MKLDKITKHNIYEVMRLGLKESQKGFVSSNALSIAESSVNPDYRTRAAVVGEKIVGFVMYTEWVNAVWMREQKPGEYYIPRVMIDKSHQGKGYGRQLMVFVLNEIKMNQPKAIHIVYRAKNTAAKNLYESFGFKEYGTDAHGDTLARIDF
ncbi:GNAT family N-acetyltransferase [Vibrio nigripulchritudo]|uniref:GNAT family N-acetyltransferase n=1 Tax=Vibrio nigripulchritudo TaxID=28173 RepID=UPI0024914464|nr:N-acetyltransferase [Vibrio nigripulchritudo]BDU40800.1 N-acetyltransferase [Vibrio nigripulchritudo]BDU46537.1 N-acetyltransferase [Vibrio nigripulchritudo]